MNFAVMQPNGLKSTDYPLDKQYNLSILGFLGMFSR